MTERTDGAIIAALKEEVKDLEKSIDSCPDWQAYIRTLLVAVYRRGMKDGFADGFVKGEMSALGKVA